MKGMRFSTVVLLVGLLVGCGDKEKTPVVKGPPPPPVDPSTLMIPIEISLSTIERQIEDKVPTILKQKGPEGDPEGISYTVRRGNIGLSAKGPTLTMRIPVSFTAEMSKKGGQQRQRPRMRGRRGGGGGGGGGLSCDASVTLTFNSKLTLGKDWKLRAKTTPGSRSWTKPCVMTPLKIDVTKKVDATIEEKVNEIVGTLDSKITNAANVEAKVTKAWDTLQTPNRMQQGFWLAMNPETIAMSPIVGKGNVLVTNVGIIAHPRVEMGEQAPVIEKKPLPDNSGQASGDKYYIALEAQLAFADATQQAKQKLVGQEFDVSGQKIKVTDASIYGNGDNFVVETQLAGALDAKVTLTGKPHYDVQTGIFSVKNLDFTVDTKSLLAKAGDWLLHGTLQQKIAEKATFPLGDKIEQGKAGLEAALNKQLSPVTQLHGTADQLRPLGVFVTENAFQVIVVAEGKMWMVVQ